MTNRYSLLMLVFTLFILVPVIGETVDHRVQKGDTLYSLSRKYGVSVDDIMKQNGLSSPNQLKTGIILQIPRNNLDYNENNWYIESSEYYVKKGDTLYSISRSNGLSVSELLEINNLPENHVLQVGEKLLLKKNAVASTVQNRVAEKEPAKAENTGSTPIWPIAGTRYKMEGKLEGVRIKADPSSYVRSIAAGKVVLAEPYRGFGNVILIDANGYIYLYGGNEDVFVNVGEEVAAGTRIGRLGTSDREDGKMDMYFSVFKDGKPVDTSTAPRG